MSGTWNANQEGLFVGVLSGGPPACLLGKNSAADLNPKVACRGHGLQRQR